MCNNSIIFNNANWLALNIGESLTTKASGLNGFKSEALVKEILGIEWNQWNVIKNNGNGTVWYIVIIKGGHSLGIVTKSDWVKWEG